MGIPVLKSEAKMRVPLRVGSYQVGAAANTARANAEAEAPDYGVANRARILGTMADSLQVQCCIAGGGPAGMMLGYLLGRAGGKTVVLEKHADVRRDFRGDT